MVGLAVYLFATLLPAYEESHDTFFANAERTFTVGSIFSSTANIGVKETDGVYTRFGPLIEAEIEEVQAVARVVNSQFLVSIDDDHYYESVRFVDPTFLEIFDFEYIEGDDQALTDPNGILLTRSMATKFFGETPALGQLMTFDHDQSLHVSAVIADLPANTHFNSSIPARVQGLQFGLIAPLAALNSINEYPLEGNWNNLSSDDFTYMLLPDGTTREWLQAKLDGIYDRHFPERSREFITGVKVRPLVEANTILWDAVGMPLMDSIRFLGFLVLVIAIVNYTNLATAQSMGRSREIGLRKTMGAARRQLVAQFMVESVTIATIAMVIALSLLELLVPVYNTAVGRGMVIDYAAMLPGLVATTIAVGLVAGAYPAYLITRAAPIDALSGAKGVKGSRFRSLMLGLQFAISTFMLAIVLIVYFQNAKIQSAGNIYPKSQIVTLQRVGVASIQARHETLRNELLGVAGVERVTFSSQLPYLQNNSSRNVTPIRGGESAVFPLNEVLVDEHFLAAYDIPLLAGRGFSKALAQDTVVEEVLEANVIVNELALSRLGFGTPSEAINQVYYDGSTDEEPRAYTIVGVTPDQNFQGFHNQIKPTVFKMIPSALEYASIRIEGKTLGAALTEIEDVWERVIPDYPIQSQFLDDTFGQMFGIYHGMTILLGSFAVVALSLSLIGLFGLSAFMAQNRTKEIGVRKVMGANTPQIVKLLVWQFSKPALWALLVALPAAYVMSSAYLDFFAERIAMPAGIVLGAGAVAVLFAWAIVAVHAIKIARANPMKALSHE